MKYPKTIDIPIQYSKDNTIAKPPLYDLVRDIIYMYGGADKAKKAMKQRLADRQVIEKHELEIFEAQLSSGLLEV